jgi:beta-galactosidase
MIGAFGGRLAFGGDYNPEQWPREVWDEDVALMREAGVNLVSLGIFSWARIEVAEGEYDFEWLDTVIDLLHANDISVDLATATASPPAWFSHAYPHTLPVDHQGIRRSFGARQAYCPSAPEYREAAARLAGKLAERYGDHPAVVMWHVNNEYGCHNWHCYCDVSAAAFRAWLQQRYASLDELNESWGTAFWSQHYTDWAQVGPPRVVAYNTFANPGRQLDWWRFSSDELLECYRAEKTALRAYATQPITTNFMSFFKPLDYWAWAPELDIVSNDHYLQSVDPDNAQELAMSADLMRSLAGGAPWLLMEHSTSAVNWQPRNIAKAPGQLRRNSLQHIARGSDGAMFFQWRASRAGAEKFHSGLVPHAGRDSKVWREVTELGANLAALGDVANSRVDPADVAILFDWPSWWAAELDSHPSIDVQPLAEARRWHQELWNRNVAVDFASPESDFTAYKVIVLPNQYVLSDAAVDSLTSFVDGGGVLVATYFSGIVDDRDHIRLGGYPGALRELLGLRIEEFFPLEQDGRIRLSDFGEGAIWSELGAASSATVLATYAEGPVEDSPAITSNDVGQGSAWYVGTQLSTAGLAQLLGDVLDRAGVTPVLSGLPTGVEAISRSSQDETFLFLINHTTNDVQVDVNGTDLITGRGGQGITVQAGGVAVVRAPRVPS